MTIDELKKLTLDQLKAISRPLLAYEIIQDGDWYPSRNTAEFAAGMIGGRRVGEWYRPNLDKPAEQPDGEIKLGWYRDFEENCVEVLFAAKPPSSQACVLILDNGFLELKPLSTFQRQYTEYLGTELPEQGEWVSPDDVKLCELPIRARDSKTLELGELLGYDGEAFAMRDENGDRWSTANCQVWRAK